MRRTNDKRLQLAIIGIATIVATILAIVITKK